MFFLVQEALSAPIELQSLTKCDPYRGRRLSFRNDYLRICSTCSWLRFYNIMAERADLLFENFVIWAHQLLNIKCQGYIVKKKNRSATPLSKKLSTKFWLSRQWCDTHRLEAKLRIVKCFALFLHSKKRKF